MSLVFLLGGARSGKSALAVRLAERSGLPVTFVATAEAHDEEMAERIARHRAARPAGWTTIEEPVDLAGALDRVAAGSCLVLDCVSLWVSNVLERGLDEAAISEQAEDVAARVARRQPLHRRLVGRTFVELCRRALREPTHDLFCGFKLWRAEAAEAPPRLRLRVERGPGALERAAVGALDPVQRLRQDRLGGLLLNH